ncbi:MAG: 2-oxoglutarate dehydrogenase complex dihydrolipoyllysine-residue succinyltransferase [Halofilum sp. (in: g-proteobacteria)]|nr:2-oxoglutarate dehydrogenase complex dihydrolipoyllysine-residue succinyltransferase [Halofilum sp. (in: g-proteobacteria)]
MSTDIVVPQLPESVSDATVAAWSKKKGDSVQRDEVLVELETDKVVLEVPAPADGVLEEILEDEGAVVTADAVLGRVSEGAAAADDSEGEDDEKASDSKSESQGESAAGEDESKDTSDAKMGPAARKLIAEHNLDPDAITGSGKDGRITKEDVLKHIDSGGKKQATAEKEKEKPTAESAPASEAKAPSPEKTAERAGVRYEPGDRPEKRVPMTRLRARIAERLLQATQQTAMLTTFNEVNMQPVMDLRARYKDRFEKTHGTKLGFMSFFVTAAAEALKRFPDINASIDGTDIVYHGYCDIGIAVSSERGLVVPILRDAETLPMAEIERQIRDFGGRAQEGKIGIDEMTGGTFTITNGGVFGSLVSTPILNMPQSAILGMHAIQERPVAENGAVVIRPMMYVALSYDHRIVDGKDSVQFLVAIKQLLEDPARLLLDI